MKKYLVLCFVCTLTLTFLASCDKENDQEMAQLAQSDLRTSNFMLGDSVVTEYPLAITEYVSQNYPATTIEEVALLEDGTYEVDLADGLELLFDASGQFIEEIMEEEEEEDEMEVTDYPASIDDYIRLNYPDAVIDEVELEDDGSYEVELDNDVELLFDADGNFLEEEIEEDDEDEDYMEVTDYPASIDDYIGLNYPGATIDEIELEDDGSYEVELDNDVELLFDADGNFLEEYVEEDNEMEEEIVVTDYPAAIDEYVAANHADTTIKEVELLADGTFEVTLEDGTSLSFDEAGNFIG